MAERIRIGAVTYLNTKPLVHRLTDLAPWVSLSFDLPSRLSDQLSRDELDVALIPAVEYFRRPDYTIVSDACIACRGPVMSVKLFSRVPPAQIRTLALDEGSRTSAAMVQTLLWQRHHVRPVTTCLPIGKGLEQATTDAVLLIGDRAIHAASPRFGHVWDLGDTWCRHTELPFVFAMWTARPTIDLTDVSSLLSQARDAGLRDVAWLAERESAAVGLTPETCLTYFQDHLHFFLGAREREGLRRFAADAAELGFVPPHSELRFDDCHTA